MSMQFINVVTKSTTSSSPTSFLAKRLFSAFCPNQSNESNESNEAGSHDPEGSNFKSFKDYRDTVQVAGHAPFEPAKAKEDTKLSETEKEKDELSKQAKEVEYKK